MRGMEKSRGLNPYSQSSQHVTVPTAGPPLCFGSDRGLLLDRELRADVSICRATRSRLSDSSHCVCLALCVRRAGGEMDSTRLPAPTSHPTSLPNRPAIPDCTNPAPTDQLPCLKDLEQTRPFFSFACLCE
ncbi:unnamed protein product [Leuciscus chuanchicus]